MAMKLLYFINKEGYVGVIEKASYSTNVGVVNSLDPLVFCMQDDLVKYYPSKTPSLLENSLLEELPVIDVRASLQSHINAGLMSSDVLELLPK